MFPETRLLESFVSKIKLLVRDKRELRRVYPEVSNSTL